MLGISTLCLHHEPLPQALEKLAAVTGYIEVMDEGLHRLETAEPLLSCSCMFSIHAPCRGTNLASLLEPIRRASVVVMEAVFCHRGRGECTGRGAPRGLCLAGGAGAGRGAVKWLLAALSCAAHGYPVHRRADKHGKLGVFPAQDAGRILPLIDGCGFTLDVGHAHQNHCLPAFLNRPGQHYHLHHNNTGQDSHRAVGRA